MSSLALALLFCLICSSLPFAHQGQQVSGGFVSVKEAGAKGDGITDDTTAIQSVLDRFLSREKFSSIRE